MKKTKVRCWKAIAGCSGEDQQTVFFTVPDFGYEHRLYICPPCGTLFVIDSVVEQYAERSFDQEKEHLRCPECQNGLSAALPYPKNYRNAVTGEIEHFERFSNKYPPDNESVILELWNPLSEVLKKGNTE